jgi:hypothetical protein
MKDYTPAIEIFEGDADRRFRSMRKMQLAAGMGRAGSIGCIRSKQSRPTSDAPECLHKLRCPARVLLRYTDLVRFLFAQLLSQRYLFVA